MTIPVAVFVQPHERFDATVNNYCTFCDFQTNVCGGSCLPDGSFCQDDFECCAGFCNPDFGTCGLSCSPDGFGCFSDAECCVNFCNPNTGACGKCSPDGFFCTNDFECRGGCLRGLARGSCWRATLCR